VFSSPISTEKVKQNSELETPSLLSLIFTIIQLPGQNENLTPSAPIESADLFAPLYARLVEAGMVKSNLEATQENNTTFNSAERVFGLAYSRTNSETTNA
jgi:hypothetical protein